MSEKRKKKMKILGRLAAVLILALALALFFLYGPLFRKAGPMILPETSTIQSVTVEGWGETAKSEDREWIDLCMSLLTGAEGTRKPVIQDSPVGVDYITVRILCKDGVSTTLYAYRSGRNLYVEQPYHGIYKADLKLDLVLLDLLNLLGS